MEVFLSADLDKITNWSNTSNMSFNPDKSHPLTMSLSKDHLESLSPHPHLLSQQSSGRSPLSSFWVSLSAMIFPGKATFPTWPPKPHFQPGLQDTQPYVDCPSVQSQLRGTFSASQINKHVNQSRREIQIQHLGVWALCEMIDIINQTKERLYCTVCKSQKVLTCSWCFASLSCSNCSKWCSFASRFVVIFS